MVERDVGLVPKDDILVVWPGVSPYLHSDLPRSRCACAWACCAPFARCDAGNTLIWLKWHPGHCSQQSVPRFGVPQAWAKRQMQQMHGVDVGPFFFGLFLCVWCVWCGCRSYTMQISVTIP